MRRSATRRFILALGLAVFSVARGFGGGLDLGGSWAFRFEENRALEDVARTDFEATDRIVVPSCYDALPKWLGKRGTGLYRRRFYLEAPVTNAWLVIDGMGLRGEFRIDGQSLGTHPYPYRRLTLETGPLAAGEHTLFAALDNHFDWQTLKLARPYYDFYCYGGFYHGVRLVFENRRLLVRTRDYAAGRVEIEAQGYQKADFDATLVFDGTNRVPARFTNARAELTVPQARTWSPESPHLHTVECEGVTARFGIRTIESREGRLYLNGRRLYLKGFNRHEAHPVFGAATPDAVMLADIQNLKALGGNFFRGAHYQQCERFLDLCDEEGVLVWEESLGWGNGQSYTDGSGKPNPIVPEDSLRDAEFVREQIVQTREMVRASFNHPSVIFYAFMNELGSYRPEARALVETLSKAVRDEDSGRLVSFACNKPFEEICCDLVDVIAFNAYPGWNSVLPPGDSAQLRHLVAEDELRGVNTVTRHLRAKYPTKPILVSEIGCCGIYGHRDATAAQWTEEFQAEYLADAIEVVFANPDLSGIAIWQFCDAKSYQRSWSVRVKPFAENLAGVYDGYRRAKASAAVVRARFRDAPAE